MMYMCLHREKFELRIRTFVPIWSQAACAPYVSNMCFKCKVSLWLSCKAKVSSSYRQAMNLFITELHQVWCIIYRQNTPLMWQCQLTSRLHWQQQSGKLQFSQNIKHSSMTAKGFNPRGTEHAATVALTECWWLKAGSPCFHPCSGSHTHT